MHPGCNSMDILYKLIYWLVEYLVNRSVIINCWRHFNWQEAVAAIHIIAMKLYWRYLNLTDGKKIAKPPN